MIQIVLFGVGAGVAAALLFLSPLSGTALAFPLFGLCGLSIAIVGLGWTWLAAAIGALVAAVLVALALGPEAAAIFLLIFGGPLTWMTRLATLSRPAGGQAPETSHEWYPLGRILIHGALAAAAGIIVVGVIIGFDPDSLAAEMSAALSAWLAAAPDIGRAPTTAEIEPFVRFNLSILPFTATALAVVVLVFNLWLGAKIAEISGRLRRPRERLWTASLPSEAAIAFPLAAGLAFLPGAVGDIAGVVAGALGAAVALIGLAVLHAVTLGNNLRILILVAAYVLLFLFGFPLLLFALLGLSESIFHFRARRFSTAPPPA